MKVIGLSGVAGSGKDTFFSALSKHAPFKRYSLADNLKAEVRREIVLQFGIDVMSCGREDKEKIRPFLVSYAKEKRTQSNGRHWIELLNKQIKESSDELICITDIRFAEYSNDEVFWLKNELKGTLVHISQFYFSENGETSLIEPANAEEKSNDPLLQQNADYFVEWERSIEKTDEYVVDFLNWYKKIIKI